IDGVCCSTTCTGTCKACNLAGSQGTCTNIPNGQDPANECIGVTTCDGAGACTKSPQGSPCVTASECATGFCADGYCCDTACSGTCKTCDGSFSELGIDGMCGDVLAATDPYNECSGTSVCCYGLCKSAGQCQLQ
ncbi:MAG: hypothetical protein R3B70_20095, partial [Polyangiaceae bacterium]